MKKKKFKAGIIITLLLSVFAANTFAYVLSSTRPNTKCMTYYTNGLSTAEKSAAMNAANTWDSIDSGVSLLHGGDRTGAVSYSDIYSDVSTKDFADLFSDGVSITATGVCFTNNFANYSTFDIYLDTNDTWGNGQSINYLDRQGNFTHEFGHAVGLADNNMIPGNTSPNNVSPSAYQTMYPYTFDPLGNNLTYYWRTLEGDDISGEEYVYSQIE